MTLTIGLAVVLVLVLFVGIVIHMTRNAEDKRKHGTEDGAELHR